MGWKEGTISEDLAPNFFDEYNGDIKKIDHHLFKQHREAITNQITKRLNNYYHKNRHGIDIDVRNINRRYAINLYDWYWERAQLFMGKQEFNATVMGSTLYIKIRR